MPTFMEFLFQAWLFRFFSFPISIISKVGWMIPNGIFEQDKIPALFYYWQLIIFHTDFENRNVWKAQDPHAE